MKSISLKVEILLLQLVYYKGLIEKVSTVNLWDIMEVNPMHIGSHYYLAKGKNLL